MGIIQVVTLEGGSEGGLIVVYVDQESTFIDRTEYALLSACTSTTDGAQVPSPLQDWSGRRRRRRRRQQQQRLIHNFHKIDLAHRHTAETTRFSRRFVESVA